MIKRAALTDSRIRRFLRHPALKTHFPEFKANAQSLVRRSHGRKARCCGAKSKTIVVIKNVRSALMTLPPGRKKRAAQMLGLP